MEFSLLGENNITKPQLAEAPLNYDPIRWC